MNRILRLVGRAHGRLVQERRSRAIVRPFGEFIGPEHGVLDVGCGDGLIDALVLERRGDLRICGVDPLVRPNARIPVTRFDGRTLPFPDGSWDTILFRDVLHHTERPVELLQEVRRVARHAVVIKDHCAEGRLARTTLRLMDVAGILPHGVALTYSYLTRGRSEHAWRDAGLVPRVERRDLRLYPAWADVLFGRSLHFIAVCEIARDAVS